MKDYFVILHLPYQIIFNIYEIFIIVITIYIYGKYGSTLSLIFLITLTLPVSIIMKFYKDLLINNNLLLLQILKNENTEDKKNYFEDNEIIFISKNKPQHSSFLKINEYYLFFTEELNNNITRIVIDKNILSNFSITNIFKVLEKRLKQNINSSEIIIKKED